MKKWLPWILVATFAAWMVGGIRAPKPKDGFNFAEFGRLPVLLNGRIQPFDSVARNSLLSISGKSSVRIYEPAKLSGAKLVFAVLTGMKKASDEEWWISTNKLSANEWLLEAMTKPEAADTRRIFHIVHQDLESLIGKPNGLHYYSLNELTNHLDEIDQQARSLIAAERAKKSDSQTRTPFQKDLMHLYDSLILYQFRIKNNLQPENTKDFVHELHLFKQSIAPGLAALKATEAGESPNESDVRMLSAFFQRYQRMTNYNYALVVPPRLDQKRDAWTGVGVNLMETVRDEHQEIHPAVTHLAAIGTAYAQNAPEEFNGAIVKYKAWLQSNNLSPEIKKGREEFFFNQLEPFYKALVIYVAALLLGCAFWIKLSEPVRRCAFALLILAFVIHTVGLVFRMYLEGRPPVTNLYSSAIFVGWGAVVLGMILEKIFKGGIGLVAASFVGFTTQIIAHHLSLSGDTMEMLRAVLDTNLWLSTHVVCITTGYSSMFLAGLLAVIYILRGFFTRSLSHDTAKSLSRMVYGIVCFSTLFSFVGTILGGIWADQSWGRFWGWDPKENGALLIVIWNAIILHARWGKLVSERGLMGLAVFGNIITSFSWFGVNMLGIGLHSYGFMDAAFYWLMLFIASQMVIIGICLFPQRMWASFKQPKETDAGDGLEATA